MMKQHIMEEYIVIQKLLNPDLRLFFRNFDKEIRHMYYQLRTTLNHDRAKIEMALIIDNAWGKGLSRQTILSYLGKTLDQYAGKTCNEIFSTLVLNNLDIKMDTQKSQDFNDSRYFNDSR